jgi:hypothetical protein
MAVLLLSTMWCDPFWDAHHGVILLAFVIVSVGSLVGSRTRLKRQRTFP